ncbi:MAG TPA: pyrroloquinoline quinone biosynthesis peptide chaperone PqqD [Myxococcota bacterium]|nr:pyrroloquinoline quinone biosynthesis peptide chaperone PqqD [Myxococcota bacterium]
MIALSAKPRLAPKARLRVDQKTGETLLLYPERGLALNVTGAEILGLCSGERCVSDIIAELAQRHGAHESLAEDVRTFLTQLAERSLLRGTEP